MRTEGAKGALEGLFAMLDETGGAIAKVRLGDAEGVTQKLIIVVSGQVECDAIYAVVDALEKSWEDDE